MALRIAFVLLLLPAISMAQLHLLAPHSWGSSYKIILHEQSSVKIHINTNVGNFVCALQGKISGDTLLIHSRSTDEEAYLNKASLKIAVQNFDCGMRQMTADMMELLQEKLHPYLTVTVMGLKKKGQIHESKARFTIAGKSNDYLVPLTAHGTGDWTYCVGRNEINITDFGLEPPTKFFGAVKVREKIEVEFNLILKIVKVN